MKLTYSSKIKSYAKLTSSEEEILINDFIEFYKYCYWWLNLPEPTKSQLYMAWYAGQLAKSGLAEKDKHRMIQAQRGLAKSLTSQILVVWLLFRNPNEKIAVISAGSKRAKNWTGFTLNLIKLLPITTELYPRTDQRKASDSFDVNGCTPSDSPSVGAYGVTSQKTGMRASFLVYDDIEIPENSNTANLRDKLLKGAMDAMNLGIANEYRSIVLCTPQSTMTVYKDMLDRGFIRSIIPARYPSDIDVYDGDLAKWIVDEIKKDSSVINLPIDERLDIKHQISQELKLGKREYKLQMMLDTTLSDEEKYPLKLRDIIVTDVNPEVAPIIITHSTSNDCIIRGINTSGFKGDNLYQPRYIGAEYKEYEGIALFIDPAGRGSDETGYCVTAQLAGKVFALDLGGFSGGYDTETLINLANIAKEFKVNVIVLEDNFGDGMYTKLFTSILKDIYPCMIEEVKATQNKEKRILKILEPILAQKKLIMDKAIFEKDMFVKNTEHKFTYQITHLQPTSQSIKHDDKIDVLAMGVKYWVDALARSQLDELEKVKQEALDKELDDFYKEFGLTSKQSHFDYFGGQKFKISF